MASRRHESAEPFLANAVLYRIIGNDLPRRHADNQTLVNLQFILDNERDLPGCEKRFVVNRVVDPAKERAIISMLDKSGYEYLHIPFVRSEYEAIGFDVDTCPQQGWLYSRSVEQRSALVVQEAFASTYRRKNNYLTNVNGARNAALADGRDRARWVLPWDGNSFLTPSTWDAIHAAMHT